MSTLYHGEIATRVLALVLYNGGEAWSMENDGSRGHHRRGILARLAPWMKRSHGRHYRTTISVPSFIVVGMTGDGKG